MADPFVVNTVIVISVVDGLLSISGTNAGPSNSSTLYVSFPKLTVGATNESIVPFSTKL